MNEKNREQVRRFTDELFDRIVAQVPNDGFTDEIGIFFDVDSCKPQLVLSTSMDTSCCEDKLTCFLTREGADNDTFVRINHGDVTVRLTPAQARTFVCVLSRKLIVATIT